MEEAAWQLARDSRELADPELTAFAGQVLALIGPLPPNALAFSALHLDTLPDQKAPQKAGGSGHRGKAAAAMDSMLVQALHLLSAFTVDEDVQTISIAQSTLRQVGPLTISPTF